MVVYIFMDGNVKIVSPENVYQGSNVTEITLLAPFPDETSVSVGFELPDGTIPEKQPMSYTQTIIDGQSVRAYVYKLPYAVTEQAGNVKMSFIAKFTNGKQTSYMANFEVQESVLPQPPENPGQDTYDLLLQYYQDAKNSAIAAQDAAEKAQEAALDANDTANTAEEKAEGAVSTANQALETAQAVESKADSAVSTAEDANKKSDNAVSTASAAATTANDAMSTANAAVSMADNAESKAESAVSIAEDANQTAEKAFSAASSAQEVADAASDTASQAQTVAEGIDGKASQALEVSQQALDTAENAQTVAEGIDGKASEALTNSEQAVSTANEAKELAEQAVAGNGTEVYVDNTLKSRVDFKSDPQTQINNIESGEQIVGKATDADNVKSQINGKNISDIFESDGTTVKKATSATQDANGNVIDKTYAKLSQVVRVDVQQPLTDANKAVFYKNSKYRVQTNAQLNEDTWKTVGMIANYGQINMTIATTLAGSVYNCVQFFLSISYLERASITSIGNSEASLVKAIRLRSKSNAQTFIDVLIGATASEGTIGIEFDVTMPNKYGITDFKTLNFVDVTDDGSGSTTTLRLQNRGIDTTGTIWQQGKPVLVGDQSAIFESDGTTVKKASKLATPRALPVNLALPSGNAKKFDGSADTSLGVTGTLPVANGGTGQSNLDNVTVGNAKKATADANGNNIPSTYATKAEATRTATYTQQGQVKMASTTNGNITDADNDDIVPTIKNICDWVKNNMLPSAAPGWVENTPGSLTLPGTGWYVCECRNKNDQRFPTGLFYWEKPDGTSMVQNTQIPLGEINGSYGTSPEIRLVTALTISYEGAISISEWGENDPTITLVRYYKLA